MARVVTSSSSVSPGSGLSQGLTGLWSAVMTGLTSKCLINSLHGLQCRGYTEVMYMPQWRCSLRMDSGPITLRMSKSIPL
jgi:hypothetical protein